jgi:decaprenyl-phosphate phosphoribosyltransferase
MSGAPGGGPGLQPGPADGPGSLSSYARAVRPRQWIKNLLVVAVPLAAGRLFEQEIFLPVVLAFAAFCLASSAVYLVNDVCDLDADRAHPTKSKRPIANGEVAPQAAILLAIVLASVALLLGWLISTPLAALIGAYLGVAVAYSLGLKDQPVLDIAVVASGFVMRALAGGFAADLPVSQWFVMMAAFGSLFMVAGKRFSEALLVGDDDATSRRSLAGYTVGYLRFVWTLAATVTVATYALWAFEIQPDPSQAAFLQLSIIPFLLGLLRYAMDIEQGRAGEPEDLILADRTLQALGVAWLVLFVAGVSID